MILSIQELLARLLLAALLGSMIGFEREWKVRAAGLRTHMLVCLGSTLIMIVSAYGFADVLKGSTNIELDPSRIAAQVVSGIGFLGAGTILMRNDIVRGLTTAASLWVVAGVGLAVGGGLYIAAAATTLIVLMILVVLRPIEKRIFANRRLTRFLTVQIDPAQINASAVESTITFGRIRLDHSTITTEVGASSRRLEFVITAKSPGDLEQLVTTLQVLRGVTEVRMEEHFES